MDISVEERVAAFFSGGLSPEERGHLLAELPENEALRKEFAWQEALFLALEEERFAGSQLQTVPKPTPGFALRRPWLYLAAASVVVFLAWYLWPGSSERPNSLPEMEGLIASADGYRDGTEKSVDPAAPDSLRFWLDSQNYPPIVAALQPALAQQASDAQLSQANADSLYFLGIAYLYSTPPTQNLTAADSLFALVHEQADNAYLRTWALRQQIEVAIRQNNRSQALSLLEILSQQAAPSGLIRKAEEVSRLIRQLEE